MMKYTKTVFNFCRNETQKLHTAQWMSLTQKMQYMIEQSASQLSILYVLLQSRQTVIRENYTNVLIYN